MHGNNILIAIDEPDWSSILVHTVLSFINKENAGITLLNVMETTSAEEEFFYRRPENFIAYEAKKAKFAYMENFLEDNNIDYKLIFEEGNAAEKIINTSKTLNADLVAVGSHNKKIFERLLLGSVAYKVLRTCPCPVMVVSSRSHVHNVRKKDFNLLLAVNGSEYSLKAAGDLNSLIDAKRANIRILNARVAPQEVIPPEVQAYADMEKIYEEGEKVSYEMLDKVYEILQDRGFASLEKISLAGKPADTILNYAQSNPIDIIAMGSPGSVSAKVSERADIPVIILRSKKIS